MQLWHDLHAAAIVGTGQQPLTLAAAPDTLASLLAQMPNTDDESVVLGTAGVLALWRLAGQTASQDQQSHPAVCAEETLPCIGPAAVEHLQMMLAGRYQAVLPEWLDLVAQSRQRVPFALLPELLAYVASREALYEVSSAVIGQRGAWLGQHNEAWRGVVMLTDDSLWHTGPRSARKLFLKRLRQHDAARARELLASTWKSDRADDRREFLSLLMTNLSDADEAFVHAALTDRSTEVRRIAVDLLLRLPQSRFAQAMIGETLPLLSWQKNHEGQSRLAVTLPEALPERAELALVDLEPPQALPLADVGSKGRQLRTMVGTVPPALWCEKFALSATEVLQAAMQSDWAKALLPGFTRAAVRSHDVGWISALMQTCTAEAGLPVAELSLALPQLAPTALESLIHQALQADAQDLHNAHPALVFLQQHKTTWSPTLSRAVLHRLQQAMHHANSQDLARWRPYALVQEFVLHMAPVVCDEFAHGWHTESPEWPQWERMLTGCLDTLQFRRAMHAAIHRED